MSARTKALAAVYGEFAPAYKRTWAPVLVRLARPLLERLPDTSRGVFADVACGMGTITELVQARRTIGADLSVGMLEVAPEHIRPVVCDARRSAIRTGSVDLTLCTFALQHVPHPGKAVGEMLRTLRDGGTMGLVTWGADDDESGPAFEVVERALSRVRAPRDPMPRGFHVRVDHPSKVARFARKHGAREIEAWSERVPFVWTVAKFLERAKMMGESGRRLAALPAARRDRAIDEITTELKALDRVALTWRPEIVFLTAKR